MGSNQGNSAEAKHRNPSIARLFARLTIAAISAAFIVALLMVQREPSIEERQPMGSSAPLGLGDILTNALGAIDDSVQPSGSVRPRENSGQRVILTAQELEAALNASFPLLLPERKIVGRVGLAADSLAIELSTPVFAATDNAFGINPYLNIAFTIRSEPAGAFPKIDELKIGNLPIPAPVAEWAVWQIIAGMPHRRMETLLALDKELNSAFDSFELNERHAVLQFHVDREALDHLSWDLQRLVVTPEIYATSAFYGSVLREYLAGLPQEKRAVALSEILPPLAAAAAARSEAGANPQTENTALLFALSAHLVLSSGYADAPNSPEIRLRRRQDLAQHVINSASIAAIAGVQLAEIISTGKEAFDARYRSGFSFSDLTANRVGIKLAQLAVESEASALAFQARVQKIEVDADLIPLVSGSRDGLTQREFEANYDDRSSVEYRRRVDSIDSEVTALPLFATP